MLFRLKVCFFLLSKIVINNVKGNIYVCVCVCVFARARALAAPQRQGQGEEDGGG
jgi:hypothetical protein